MTNSSAPRVSLLSTGGPTALIELGGLRLLTDPTFDEPREYVSGTGAKLTKTGPAVLGPEDFAVVEKAFAAAGLGETLSRTRHGSAYRV